MKTGYKKMTKKGNGKDQEICQKYHNLFLDTDNTLVISTRDRSWTLSVERNKRILLYPF